MGERAPDSGLYEALEFVPENYFQPATLDHIFGSDRAGFETELDLGCGDGGFLMRMAEHYPGRNFLGVERLLGRVRKVSRKGDRRGLGDRLRLLRLESRYSVEWLLPKASFQRVHLLFPDPWPKKKHHRRRIVTEDMNRAIQDLLVDGGEFLFKTDHEEYFDEAAERILGMSGWERLPWDLAVEKDSAGSFYYAETDFERLWKSEGKKIQGVRMRKVTSA